MLGKNMIELINTLNENEWEYQVINGVFHITLGNNEEIFHVSNEEKAKELIEVIKNW